MDGEIKFSSKRLFLTLMLCACSIILLQNYNISSANSFAVNILSLTAGIFVCALLFLPSVFIKKKYGTDFITLARASTPRLIWVLAVFYSLYFVYTASYFLLRYTDMFHKKYYPEISPCVIAVLLLSACVYAAFKGVNVITRFGIFLFAFAMLTNILIFFGAMPSVDFSRDMPAFYGKTSEAVSTAVYFITPAFIAVIFACLGGDVKSFSFRQPLISLALTALKYAFIMFFTAFALDKYADRQEYQTFVLSRVVHFSSFAGIESLFTGLATMSVFMIISLFLCCINKITDNNGSLKNIIIFASIIIAAAVAATYNNSVLEILFNETVLNIFSSVAALLPLIYFLKGGKKLA